MAYSSLQLFSMWQDLWELWPNKTDETSSKKAFEVCMASFLWEDLKKGCETYLAEKTGTEPKFIHKLGNFIRGDTWRDYLQNDKALEVGKEAKKVVEVWNEACRPHWAKCHVGPTRIELATLALQNKDFRDNWKKALAICSNIFQYERSSNDPFSNLVLSLPWFSNVSIDKHTVLKILEGTFGEASYKIPPKPAKEARKVTLEERARLVEECKEIFADFKSDGKGPTPRPPEPKNNIILSQEALILAEAMQRKLGQKKETYEENDTKAITDSIVSSVENEHDRGSEEIDPFE